MGKTTEGRNFSCHKTHCFKPKLVLQVRRANHLELSMLALDLVVDSRLKNTQWYFCGIHTYNYIVWLHPMTNWLVIKLLNTAMLTKTSMSFHKASNNITNLLMFQMLHSIITLIETSYSFFA